MQPGDYEPPFFKCCSESEAPNNWTKNPLKMEVGNVNSKHFVLALKVWKETRCKNLNFLCSNNHGYNIMQVKSVLDPCEDENNDASDNEVCVGADQDDDSSSSDSEVDSFPEPSERLKAKLTKVPFSVEPLFARMLLLCCRPNWAGYLIIHLNEFQVRPSFADQFVVAPIGKTPLLIF